MASVMDLFRPEIVDVSEAETTAAVQHVLKAVGLILLAPASAGLGYAAHIGRHLLHVRS